MIRLIFTIMIIAIISINPTFAQITSPAMIEYLNQKRAESPFMGHYTLKETEAAYCMLNDSVVLDECKIRVEYAAKIVLDTVANFKCNDVVVVDIGNSVQKFYSYIWWRRNMNYTLFELKLEDEQVSIPKSKFQPAIDYAIFRDLQKRKLTNHHQLYGSKKQIFEYEEDFPQFEWQLSADTTTIQGYVCQKAEAEFRGRRWTVWFTPEIPIDGGLWKFNGLPGLILRAYDALEHFYFDLQSISHPQQTGICLYKNKTKRMTREKYRELEHKIFQTPFSPYDGIAVINRETGKHEWLPADWSMPYNPIELY